MKRLASLTLDLASVGMFGALRLVPWRVALGLGTLLGTLAGVVPGRKRRRTEANLLQAGVADPSASCRRAWVQTATTFIEMLWDTTRTPQQVLEHTVVEDLDVLGKAARSGRGVLLLSAHVGNWERVAQAAALSGVPVAVIARRLRTRRVERRQIDHRSRCGVRTLVRGEPGAGVTAARWLRRGGVLACMTDRASSGRRIALPFLGSVTNVPLGPFELAARARSAVVVGWARRREDGCTAVVFRKLLDEATGGPEAVAALVTRALSQEVGGCPEQWFWIYRRQPAAEEATVS